MENNKQYNNETDSLKSPSFSIFKWELFSDSRTRLKNTFQAILRQREDRIPIKQHSEKLFTRGGPRVVEGSFGYLKNPAHRFTRCQYRDQRSLIPSSIPKSQGQTILGRVEHYIRILKVVFILIRIRVGSGSDMKIRILLP